MMEETEEGDLRPSTGTTELSVDMREFGAMQTRRGSTHMASMSTINIMDESDVRPTKLLRQTFNHVPRR
jgi:hypothetical protein